MRNWHCSSPTAPFGLILSLCLAGVARPSVLPDESSSLPYLPQLSLDSFLPPIRAAVEKAYANAAANPRDAVANGELGMVIQAHGLYEMAEVCYRRAHLLDPASFSWAYYLGLVLTARGKYDEALTVLGQALSLDPEYVPAQLKTGECLLASARWEEARKVYEKILERHPDSAEGHYGLGRARAGLKDLEGAVESFRKACELFPHYGAAHYTLALAYRDLGRIDQSREELSLFERNKHDVPGSGDRLQAELYELYTDPQYLLQLGIESANQGKLEQAVVQHEKALQIDPQLIKAHVNLISLYGRLGEAEKAEEHYRAALGLHPNFPEAYYYYGLLEVERGKMGEGEEAFRRVVEINPYHAEAHNQLGDLLQRQGRWSEAKEEFGKAIESRPNFAAAHFNLGRLLVNQKEYGEGVEHLLKSLSTEDAASKPAYLYAVGAAYARAGDRGNAVRYLRMAREQAAAQNQAKLVAAVERDLQIVEGRGRPAP
jgi:tetratricopeptide (TPR) repeat protein